MKIKITARKYEGDDKYSWAVFRSDRRAPCFTGLGRSEVAYYKKLVGEIIKNEQKGFTEFESELRAVAGLHPENRTSILTPSGFKEILKD